MSNQQCSGSRPIGLVHGFGFPNNYLGLRYWGTIPENLKALGYSVHMFDTSAFGPICTNTTRLVEQIEAASDRLRGERLTLVCHSRGAVEACLAAADPRLEGRIDSILGFGAPVFGSSLARTVAKRFPEPRHLIYRILNLAGNLLGDDFPDSHRAIHELTVERTDAVETLQRSRGVQFVLIYSSITRRDLPLPFRLLSRFGTEKPPTGDGIVDAPACSDGLPFKAIELGQAGFSRVTHWMMTGLPAPVRFDRRDPWPIFRTILETVSSKRY